MMSLVFKGTKKGKRKMNTIGFEMDLEHVKEFLLHQCQIAESLGAITFIKTENGLVFFDRNNEEVLRINF